MPTVLDELRCGHITSVYFGMGWRELFWKKCLAVVPCATADEESGSSLKLGSCVDQPLVLFGTRKLVLENALFQLNPCINIAFHKSNPSLILELPCALYSVYTPSVGVVRLAEYVCTHPFSNFYRGRSRLGSRRR